MSDLSPAQTAGQTTWTPEDEAAVQGYAAVSNKNARMHSARAASTFARELIRLRAENERLTALVQRVVDEHEIHDNDTLLNALLENTNG